MKMPEKFSLVDGDNYAFIGGKSTLICFRQYGFISGDYYSPCMSHNDDKLLAILLQKIKSKYDGACIYTFSNSPTFERCGYKEMSRHGTILIDLSRSEDELFSDLNKHKRQAVKKALASGLTVDIEPRNSEQTVQKMRVIYEAWTRAKGIDISHFDWLLKKADYLPNNQVIFFAVYKEKPVACSGWCECGDGMVIYLCNASLPGYRKLYPNDLLMWKMILYCKEHGYKIFNMTNINPYFKRGFGGKKVYVHRYVWMPRSMYVLLTIYVLATYILLRCGMKMALKKGAYQFIPSYSYLQPVHYLWALKKWLKIVVLGSRSLRRKSRCLKSDID